MKLQGGKFPLLKLILDQIDYIKFHEKIKLNIYI